MNLVFRQASPADYSEVRRITREAYLQAGHFTADHPYMRVLGNVETGRSIPRCRSRAFDSVARQWQPYSEIAIENELEFRMLAVDPAHQGGGVGRAVVRQVIEHAKSRPAIRAISITSATFMERAHILYESLGFKRVPARDWYVPGENVLLWVFRHELQSADALD